MKNDKLKKLFDHVDENETSTVEFQTVWRKVHRRDWKRRLFQSAGPNIALLMIILVLTPLAGYYLISPEPATQSSHSKVNHELSDYELTGKVYNFPNQIVIKGETGLPEGAILTIDHFKRDGKTLISREKVTTTSDGYFQFTTHRLEGDKEYIVKVMLYPHLQNDSIKKLVGRKGEYLKEVKNKESVFHYHHKEVEYFGLKLVGLVNKIDDTPEQISAEFLMSEQEFEAVY